MLIYKHPLGIAYHFFSYLSIGKMLINFKQILQHFSTNFLINFKPLFRQLFRTFSNHF